MITLTSDKHAIVKANFSIEDSVHQGHEQSTPCQETHLGGFAPLRKVIRNIIGMCGAMGQSSASQKAIYPHLAAIVRRPV
jgi:hypothetical protein